MKKILAFLMFLLLAASAMAAGPQGIHEPGTGLNDTDDNAVRPVLYMQKNMTQIREQINEQIRERQQEMNGSMAGMNARMKNVYMNQNQVRLAVHALLAMENLTGGIGRNISQIARQFNNSVMSTIRAESKIQNRSRIARFFAGGDSEAADELEQDVNQNMLRIQELQKLRQQCNCSEEVRAMIQEQVQNMELEQNRLRQLAQAEKQKKGLFGWLWK